MFIYYLISIFSLFDIVLCCNIKNVYNDNLLYNYLINNKYNLAKKELDKINENDLFSSDLKKYLIKKMFVNYKLNNLELSNKILDKLLILYKNDNNLDYIIYMKGLVNFEINEKIVFKCLSYDNFNKNHEYMYKSLEYFKYLVDNFKNSKYYENSIYKILYIKQRLFVHDLYIIDFYFRKNNHISVINRSIHLLKFFPKEPYIYYLIEYIKKSCKLISLNEIEEKLDIIINSNISNFKKLKIKI
ncbi:outer membrane protein assembly factor BamD [endosymbiont of Pachyrhynchus infernalis]|uniref:outer membrane protein assembly factor BamD n=1 Tax=endosymbiont of Pachyrhynchus infernalis TaxID=1971488 RepID=UPI000DC73621|nr:outer membrane protein assembly factor BamD [endosymbiont of Pachyrhynchus infernalis]BBA84877.1 outer membrane protein assembly factor BamD [endosymbiont of Pachyrhynchus infernalis]